MTIICYHCRGFIINDMRGAIYSRVSTIDQDYKRQTNELRECAKAMDIEIIHVFEEKESGFNNDRPEFAKLKELTKEDIDIILYFPRHLFVHFNGTHRQVTE